MTEFESSILSDHVDARLVTGDLEEAVADRNAIVQLDPDHPGFRDPEYRRRGIARQIMQTMISWCKQQGFARITLHASEHGRHLYESLGFVPNNEMRLNLR